MSGMFTIGLDLGQRNDPSAVVMVEQRRHPYRQGNDPVLRVRMAERIPLGTGFGEVAQMMRHVVQVANREAWQVGVRSACKLVIDATGLGRPVVEMVKDAVTGLTPGCSIIAVTITSGDKQHYRSGEGSSMNVPKQDLIAELQLALDSQELKSAARMREAGTLTRELLDMRMHQRQTRYVRYGADGTGQHDDLVIALALAVWRARRF